MAVELMNSVAGATCPEGTQIKSTKIQAHGTGALKVLSFTEEQLQLTAGWLRENHSLRVWPLVTYALMDSPKPTYVHTVSSN